MLNILLNQIQSVIQVKAITEINSVINIEYFDNNSPSPSQIDKINNLLIDWPLKKIKFKKIDLLDQNWKKRVKTGWQTPAGYSLGIDISDVTLLTGAFILSKEANAMGMNDPINIVDTNGESHALSVQDLTVLMLQYGQARAILSNLYANLKKSINESTSIEELNTINFVALDTVSPSRPRELVAVFIREE